MEIDLILRQVAAAFNLDESSLLAVAIIVSAIANIVSRLIPDDAVGWQAAVRRVTAILGMHVHNRVTKATTTEDMARTLAVSVDSEPVDFPPDHIEWPEPMELLSIPPEVEAFLARNKEADDAR